MLKKKSDSKSFPGAPGIALLLVLTMAIAIGGCSGASPRADICDGKDSVICEVVPDPLAADIVLQLANVEAVKEGVYSPDEAVDVIDQILDALSAEEVPTYGGLGAFAASRIKGVEPEIVVLSGYIDLLNQDIPIKDYDAYLIRTHLERQKTAMLSMVE